MDGRARGDRPRKITLIGFMGTGKTSVGRELGRMFEMEAVDVDRVIEEREGMTITRMFAERGEPYFRELERKAVAELTADGLPAVVCSGGGVVLDERNVENLRNSGPVVWLKASPEVIHARIANEGNRPVLKDGITVENIRGRLEKRLPLYEKAADLAVDTDGKTVDQICVEIRDRLASLELGRPLKG